MNPLSPFFVQQKFMLLDGGLATELENKGYNLNDALWSARLLLEAPDAIQRVHLAYLEAGADIITTASYQATIPALLKKGLTKIQAVQILKISYHLANNAVEDFWRHRGQQQGKLKPLVAASIGPYGAFLADGSEYKGVYQLSLKELQEFHLPRMEALYEAGVRLFAFETIPNEKEAKLLVELLKDFPQTYAWLSFSCRDGLHISNGTRIKDAITAVHESEQIIALGINCTAPQHISSLIQELKRSTQKTLIVYPNNGDQWDATRHCWLYEGKEFNFKDAAQEWLRLGAGIIGGCCRISPSDIAELAELRYSA